MKRKRYTQQQIAFCLRQHETVTIGEPASVVLSGEGDYVGPCVRSMLAVSQ